MVKIPHHEEFKVGEVLEHEVENAETSGDEALAEVADAVRKTHLLEHKGYDLDPAEFTTAMQLGGAVASVAAFKQIAEGIDGHGKRLSSAAEHGLMQLGRVEVSSEVMNAS